MKLGAQFYSIRDLTVRFELEKERIAKGKSVKNKEFYKELKERIKHENHQDTAIQSDDQDA